jgi:Ca2+-binding EF-hand superfamily protein
MDLSAVPTSEPTGQEVAEFNRTTQECEAAEDGLMAVAKADNKITLRDLEALLLHLGVSAQQRVLDHMLYEVDEAVDDVICWDEFQLCYHRNVNDPVGHEPSSFFRVLEFVIFDHSHRGVIQEDDVMEVLFVRIGASRLEQEIAAIFGNQLRALGGPGTLTLEAYLGACLRKTGRRALVF